MYWLLGEFEIWWLVLMAALHWLFSAASLWLAPLLLMPLFYKIEPLNNPKLVARLTRLAESAARRCAASTSMNMSNRTTTANAMLAGLGSTRRIILGDTLLFNDTDERDRDKFGA